MTGEFAAAWRQEFNRLCLSILRREERAILWSGRGWTLPENQWRYYFRGSGCE